MTVALQDAAVGLDASAVYDMVRVPTLIVSRRDDPVGPPEIFAQLAARIPRAELVVLEGNAHLPHEGDVDALVDAVLSFTGRSTQFGVPHPGGPASTLTSREAEILDLLAQGLSNHAISERLVLSVRTVERHTLNIYMKLGVRGRTEAVAVAYPRAIPPASA
jgi:DNA-binding CsgD family transcriptional regulator